MESFRKPDTPYDFFRTWDLSLTGDQLRSGNFLAEVWEVVDGRTCLKVRLDIRPNDPRRELDFKQFWVDIDRNVTVLKMEQYIMTKK